MQAHAQRALGGVVPRWLPGTWPILLLAVFASAPAASEPGHILVRLRAEGPHAVTECAEALDRRGAPLAPATRDRSDSLDRLHAELGVERVRAVFRSSDGRSLTEARESLRARALRGRRSAISRVAREALPDLSHVYRLELAPGVAPRAAAARYRSDPHVVWAQADFVAALDLVADDPYLASAGSWGQSFADLWGIHRVDAPAAWDLALGEGVVVAVVDTGVDLDHPDLAANAWVNPGEDLDGDGRVDAFERNGRDDDDNGFVDDFHGFDFANSVDADGDGDFEDPDDVSDADPFDDVGHGTHIAGTVAAVAGNGIGVAGVAPRARIMAVKGFGESGSATFEVLARGMVYAIHNGASVINNSWSCGRRCPSNPIMEEVVALANALGVVVVTSAGNRGDDVAFYSPENRHGTLVVGASDTRDATAGFSNRGHLMDVLAPGSGPLFGAPQLSARAILSLRSSGANDGATGQGAFVVGERYLRWSGTSMAAPHVTGMAALLLSQRPGLTPEQVRGVIRAAARDLGTAGHDHPSGAGLANALAALTRGPPAVGGAFSQPSPAAVLRPQDGPVSIRGRLEGDVAEARLSFGVGWDPEAYEPLPLRVPPGPFEGELAVWDVPSLPGGPYLLRLEVFASDGERVVEFLPLSLERPVAREISSEGAGAQRPAIAGDLVVWESRRPEEPSHEGAPPVFGLDLFARTWTGDEPWALVAGAGDQHEAHLSGRRLAWKDDAEGAHAIRSCRVDRRGRRCDPGTASEGADVFPGLSLWGPWTVWTDRLAGRERLRGCVWVGRWCRPVPLPGSDDRQSDPLITRDRLYWGEWQTFPPRLFTCVGPGTPRCRPTEVRVQGEEPPLIHAAAADGDLLAWMGTRVRICRVEPDGTCRALSVGSGTTFGAQSLEVSGHRVVWSDPGPGGDDDVHLCEYDTKTGVCPVQRLSASAANQRNPAIDGDRVVWEDDGEGFESVYGIELPSLLPVRDRRVSVGRRLSVLVRGRDPTEGAPVLSAEFADGTPLRDRGARFVDFGFGLGLLVWHPDDAGSHVVTFAARGSNGLVARRSARIEVTPALRGPGAP